MRSRLRDRLDPEQAARRPAGRAPAAGVLALQGKAGNAAVGKLLRLARSRTAFERTMQGRFGVRTVRAGTEADQVAEMRRMTPSSEQAPTSIAGWQAWDPPAESELYADVEAGFEAMARVLGGTPEVRELRFVESDYENVGGRAQRREEHGAYFSGGLLSIFKRMENMTWRFAAGRSSEQVRAPVTYDSKSASRRRIIVHELAHAVAERFGTPGASGGEQGFFAAFNRAAGWSGGQIVQDGTALTGANWNDPWPEQPMSAYSLSNPGEDFAESLMAYIERPDVLRARSPARYEFFHSRRGGWASHLRRPT